MSDRLIITAALAGGVTTKHNNPNTPYTPEEFAEESYRCLQEGVSIVHIHVKDPTTGMATADVKLIENTVFAIRDRCPELIINLDTGITMGVPAEQRIRPVLAIKPEMASLGTSSMNFAIADHKSGKIVFEYIYENPFGMLEDFARKMKGSGVKPESEIFDPGGLNNVLLIRRQGGVFDEPLHLLLIYGVAGGMSFDPLVHLSLIKMMPEKATYTACGVGPNQYPVAFQAAITAGHIRIGFEDNVRMPSGELAKGNWEQALWAKDLARIIGRPIATPAEAREILRLPPRG